jgi:hypothetical protein
MAELPYEIVASYDRKRHCLAMFMSGNNLSWISG